MNEELCRKIKETKTLHEKYIQMMDEPMIKEKMIDEDFNRRIIRCIIV